VVEAAVAEEASLVGEETPGTAAEAADGAAAEVAVNTGDAGVDQAAAAEEPVDLATAALNRLLGFDEEPDDRSLAEHVAAAIRCGWRLTHRDDQTVAWTSPLGRRHEVPIRYLEQSASSDRLNASLESTPDPP
jgi:hypothetical protein